jgi:26S proteasome regulatory subunit N5
MRQHTHPF